MPFNNDDDDQQIPPDEGLPESQPDGEEARTCEVKVVGVFEDVPENEQAPPNYFVLLRDNLDRRLPVLIGPFEAQAIAWAVRGERLTPRPMTHDLLKNVIERLGAKVDRLTIDDLWQETYYAKVSLAVGNKIIDVDTRPSDGIALAMRADAPIYVSEAVLEEANRPPDSGDSLEEPFTPPDEE